MSSGTQADEKISALGHDYTWNAVWESEVTIDENGWYIEMKIPYSALRFSSKSENWSINFYRTIKSVNEKYSWNYIDKSKGEKSNYSGTLKGINSIKPPVRLSFYPYAQGSVSNYKGEISKKGTSGLDLKYGINESFTIDATLIPDFGQTEFDEEVLNLGPFEQQYEEKRAFFTEGTNLFTKGNLFYSRRIGAKPSRYNEVYKSLNDDEVVKFNPDKSKMYNALKLSGRTKRGLGVGVFNAVSAAKATILNTKTNTEKYFITEPLTNYSVLVIDRTFNKNSSFSIINTHVGRKGYFINANVTSLLLDYHTFDNNYALNVDLSMSKKYKERERGTGFKTKIIFKKTHGAHRFSTKIILSDSKYDKNDFGIQDYNNFVHFAASYYYRMYKPSGIYNKWGLKAWSYLEYKYKPFNYADNGLGLAVWAKTRKQLKFGANLNLYIGYLNDFYEPRVEGMFFKNRQLQYVNLWFMTDLEKKFSLHSSITMGSQFAQKEPQKSVYFKIKPKYRFNKRFQMHYAFNWQQFNNKKGYVDSMNDLIIFGTRDERILINSLQSNYNLSRKSVLTLMFRYNWTQIDYKGDFYELQHNGLLKDYTDYTINNNENVNYWNLDLNYSWEFAPGSQFIVQYRNIIFDKNNFSKSKFINNMNNMFNQALKNELSLKMIYYIDYNKLKYQ
jgi:hypothetical protein